MFWTNPHPLSSWPFSKLSCGRFDFFPRKFAACSKPPSRDNYRKASYPRTQQRDQGAGWTHDPAIRVVGKNDAFTHSATLPTVGHNCIHIVIQTQYAWTHYFVSNASDVTMRYLLCTNTVLIQYLAEKFERAFLTHVSGDAVTLLGGVGVARPGCHHFGVTPYYDMKS